MIEIPMKSKGAIDRNTIQSLNRQSSSSPASGARTTQSPPVQNTMPSAKLPKQQQIPALTNPIQKGQKVSIETAASLPAIKACFGWNVSNPQCDVDVSAFLLGADGKILGDSWFVFYGQTKSPDGSTVFQVENNEDREKITIDFHRLNPNVKKIVFVLTINEAFEKKLHFGMLKDAYVRILDAGSQRELVSFQMPDYYSNVISMMIGELYQHNDIWKFGAIGNGVAKDLAGLCAFYGVQVND